MRCGRWIAVLLAAMIVISCGDRLTAVPPSSTLGPVTLADLETTGALRLAFNASSYGVPSEGSSLFQCNPEGTCRGLGPALADELVRGLGVRLLDQYYNSTDTLFDGGRRGEWDMTIAIEDPTQAGIAFTPPFLAIDQTYAVPASSAIRSAADVDRVGIRVAVVAGTSLERYLGSILFEATLIAVTSDPLEIVAAGGADVAAGSRRSR